MLAHAAEVATSPVPPSLMREFETELASESVARRTVMLHRVTDLFVDNAAQLSETQTTLFDDVMTRLIDHIERRTLAELSTRLAPIANAPTKLVRGFARDDAIMVAGPVLSRSERLTDDDLIAIASSKSQAHLTHIARRPRLSEAVTDTLVDHGDLDVATTVAGNRGARFSRGGMSKLVVMADGNDDLAEAIGGRTDIPPRLFRQLLAQATEIVRERLMARARPEARHAMQQIVEDVAAKVGASTVSQRAYAEAQRVVNALSQDTEMMKQAVFEFANGHRVAELVTVLSVLSGVAVHQVDRIIHASSFYGTMVLCKALSLDWPVAEAVLRIRQRIGAGATEIEGARREYPWLSVASAQRTFRFWRVRHTVS
jgi:uncharacterized protein (DUF2336 family)